MLEYLVREVAYVVMWWIMSRLETSMDPQKQK